MEKTSSYQERLDRLIKLAENKLVYIIYLNGIHAPLGLPTHGEGQYDMIQQFLDDKIGKCTNTIIEIDHKNKLVECIPRKNKI